MNNAKKAALFGVIFLVLVLVGGITKLFFLMFFGFFSLLFAWYFGTKTETDFINQSEEYFNKTLKEKNFTADKKTLTHDKLQGLAISESQKKVILVTRKSANEEYSIKMLKFKDVIEVKVITNKQTITSTSVGSALSRGIAGTLIAGSIGGIVGGATAKQKSSSKIKELILEIVVDDILNPRQTITFYKNDLPIKETSPLLQEVEEWYRTFSVIINRNNQESRSV